IRARLLLIAVSGSSRTRQTGGSVTRLSAASAFIGRSGWMSSTAPAALPDEPGTAPGYAAQRAAVAGGLAGQARLACLTGGRDPLAKVEDRHVTTLLACCGEQNPSVSTVGNVSGRARHGQARFHEPAPR